MSDRKIYAVRVGYRTGLYYSWDDCQDQVRGCSGAEYKSFFDVRQAKAYLRGTNFPNGKVYAVRVGRKPGLYFSWDECMEQVKGYSGAQHRAFFDEADACSYLIGEHDVAQQNREALDFLKEIKADVEEGLNGYNHPGDVLFEIMAKIHCRLSELRERQ